jgi:hypothetical protein
MTLTVLLASSLELLDDARVRILVSAELVNDARERVLVCIEVATMLA